MSLFFFYFYAYFFWWVGSNADVLLFVADLFKREVNEITKTAKRVKERRDPKSLQRRQCQAFVGNDGVNLSSSEIEESVITAPPTSSETVSATSASTVAPTVSTEASEAPASDTPDVVRATAGLTQEELEDLGFL